MSESTNEKTPSTGESQETPEVGLIGDEQLPEDLRPEENPLAADPDDDAGEDSGDGAGEPKVEGMPDMGQPG